MLLLSFSQETIPPIPSVSQSPTPPAENMADLIHSGIIHLSTAMPLLAAAAIIASLLLSPSGQRSRVAAYLLVGAGTGFIGANVIEPIKPGGWNWQFIFYPFLFAKWLFIGFVLAWGIGTLSALRQRALGCSLLFIATIPLLESILDRTYVPLVFQRDRAYWQNVFTNEVSRSQLELAPDRLSHEGRESVSWQLHYKPHEIREEVLTELAGLGFNVLHARNASPKIRAAAIAGVQAKLSGELSEWNKSQAVAPLVPLASNPTLDDSTFQLLAQIGDADLVSSLIRNEGNTDTRMQWLRAAIERRVASAKPDNDSDRFYLDRLKEQLDHLDRWWHFKKTGEWESKSK
jgi:hypothetical protein